MESPMKKGTEKDSRKLGPMSQKQKWKWHVTTKHDMRKLLPGKSTRATPGSPILDSPLKLVEEGDALAQAEAIIEVERKEESTKKHKVKKQVEVDQATKTKGNGIVESSTQKKRRK